MMLTKLAAGRIALARRHGWRFHHTMLGAAVLHMRRYGRDYWLHLHFDGTWF